MVPVYESIRFRSTYLQRAVQERRVSEIDL